jgi:hypothetical protein
MVEPVSELHGPEGEGRVRTAPVGRIAGVFHARIHPRTHLRVYEDLQRKLGQSIAASASTFNKAATEFNKIDKDVVKITGETLPEIEEVPGENEIPE